MWRIVLAGVRGEKAAWKGWSGRGRRSLGRGCGAHRVCDWEGGILQIWGDWGSEKLRAFCVPVNNVLLVWLGPSWTQLYLVVVLSCERWHLLCGMEPFSLHRAHGGLSTLSTAD